VTFIFVLLFLSHWSIRFFPFIFFNMLERVYQKNERKKDKLINNFKKLKKKKEKQVKHESKIEGEN